jgi:nitrate reductase gamma subunit
MIGAWSAHAQTFLLVASILSALGLSLPIFLVPLAWARRFGWTIPDHTDLAVYFGRSLGALAVTINLLTLRAALTGEALVPAFEVTLIVSLLMVVVHVYGALRRVQPVSETLEIGFWAAIALFALACWPGGVS